MKLQAVQSSQINAIGHAAATKTMQIEFKGGSLYEYANVTAEEFEKFSKAPSIGSYFFKHFKNDPVKYPYVKLEANKAIDALAPEPIADAVVHPGKPGSPPDPVPKPHSVVADEDGAAATSGEEAALEEHEQPGGGGL